MSFLIDNYHPLSSYSLSEEKKSIMNTSFKKMLYSPKHLDNIFDPMDLKNTFSIRFEMELQNQIFKKMRELYQQLGLSMDKTYSNSICIDVSGPFQTIIGVDSFHYGWNKVGLCFQKEKEEKKGKEFYYPIFKFLIQFFYKHYHFQPFYGKSIEEINDEKKNFYIENYISIQEWELEEIYDYEVFYPNSFLYMIQKIWRGKIRVWEQLKILKEVKKIVYRSCQIPDIDDMKCNNNLLYLYYHGKLRLPRKIRDTLQHFEEIQLTDMELELYQNYSPFFQENKHSLLIDKKNPLHPEFPRRFIHEGYQMTSILQCIHFQLLLPYCSKEKAYQSSFHLTSSLWDEILSDFFKKIYYTETNLKMKELPNRLSLLEIKEKKIENQDMLEPITGYKENFLGRILENSRREMNDYLLPSDPILQETILFMLQNWLELWKEEMEEKECIDFFFEFWFPFFQRNPFKETDIIYPIRLKNSDHHDYIYSYLSSNLVVEKGLDLIEMMKVWKKYLKEESISYFLSNVSKFQNFTKEIQYYLQFDFPIQNIEFKEQEELSLFYYISFDYFLFKN